jgi:hypothetical protein
VEPPAEETAPAPAAPGPTPVVVERVVEVAATAPGLRPVAPMVDPSTPYEACCPNCGHPGKLDMVDLVAQTSHYVCRSCSTMWHVASPSRR